MILLELTTESGATYIANVVNRRIRRVTPEGEHGEWADYQELQGGGIGERLVISYPDETPETATHTTRVEKIYFRAVE